MSWRMSSVVLVTVSALLGGCASRRVGEVAEYRGRYSFGFEESTFAPCGVPGSDGPWWVIPSNDALRQRDSLIAALPGSSRRAFFVRWRGLITAKGPAGHLGQGTRYIHVAEILELRPVSIADCFPSP